MKATKKIDRTGWAPGPWDDEPDRDERIVDGYHCLAVRAHHGAWCGYVAVPPGHPWHGVDYSDLPDYGPDVHGGLTYASECYGQVCHVPAPGEPDNVWWLGFDCHHYLDRAPGSESTMRNIGCPERVPVGAYRTLDYVRGECDRLVAAVKESAP